MSLFEKVSYIELRMMRLVADHSDYQRQLAMKLGEFPASTSYLKEGIRRIKDSWTAARKRFKDSASSAWQATWDKLWEKVLEDAIQYHKDWMLELNKENKDRALLQTVQEHIEILGQMKLESFPIDLS